MKKTEKKTAILPKKSQKIQKRSRFGPDDDYWYQAVTGPTITGVEVDEDKAMTFATVFACVRVIAETVASLPLKVYEKIESGGKDEAPDHNLYDLLHIQPNPLMTSFQWREVVMAHVLLWGNAYSEISRDGTGRIGALWPLNPSRMEIKSDEDNIIQYKYTPEGKNESIYFDFDEIFHPAYYEDSDYLYRMKLLGIKQDIDSTLNPEIFRASQTFEKNPKLVNEAMKNNRLRYIEKWGNSPLLEIFTTPYNEKYDIE